MMSPPEVESFEGTVMPQWLVRDNQASEHIETLIAAFLLPLPLSLNGPPFQNWHLDFERCKQRASLAASFLIYPLSIKKVQLNLFNEHKNLTF